MCGRFIESYKPLVIDRLQGYPIYLGVILILSSLFLYAFTFLVILATLPIVFFVVTPLSWIWKTGERDEGKT